MRIVAGQFKGKQLFVPEGRQVRPTTDRIRESLFNVLAHGQKPIDGALVLDLFAGSGALGLEALSRGAKSVLFVENNAEARAAIQRNIETLGATGQTRLYRRDACELGDMPPNRGGPFDLVFLDPPYGLGLGEKALTSAQMGGWLAPEALIVFECGRNETPSLDDFTVIDERLYGDTLILFLVAKEPSA